MGFGIETIRDAAQRIEGQVRVTPLLSSPMLDELTGARVLVKAESLQLTGSFKIRGALNTLLSLTDAERSAGVLAFSTGKLRVEGSKGVALKLAGLLDEE